MFNIKINNKIPKFGYTDFANEEIVLNLKKGDVVDTIIHEKLHEKYPQMPHNQIYKKTDQIEGKMSLLEMAELLTETHMKTQYPTHKREITYTEASNVIETKIK